MSKTRIRVDSNSWTGALPTEDRYTQNARANIIGPRGQAWITAFATFWLLSEVIIALTTGKTQTYSKFGDVVTVVNQPSAFWIAVGVKFFSGLIFGFAAGVLAKKAKAAEANRRIGNERLTCQAEAED